MKFILELICLGILWLCALAVAAVALGMTMFLIFSFIAFLVFIF